MRILSILFIGIFFCLTISVVGAQSDVCEGVVDDLPTITIGLVFPSDTFIMPNRGDFHRGAWMMAQTMNDCTQNKIEWVSEFAEDYDTAVQAVQRLTDEHDVQLIVGGGSIAIGNGIANTTQELDIIFWETTDGIADGGVSAFSVTNNSVQRGLNVAEFIRNTYGDDARIALIYNERERSAGIAEGINSMLGENIVIENTHDESISASDIAVSIRRQEIDVVVLATFQTIADSLWFAMRNADANVAGWINVGDPGYSDDLCERLGRSDGLITIHRFAMTQPDNLIFDTFATNYESEYDVSPDERAHLTASGVYMLMNYVLPQIDDTVSTETIREAISQAFADIGDGLMGEGLEINSDSGTNELASLVVQQNQSGQFCTVLPSALANCEIEETLVTWRDRAVIQDQDGCINP